MVQQGHPLVREVICQTVGDNIIGRLERAGFSTFEAMYAGLRISEGMAKYELEQELLDGRKD